MTKDLNAAPDTRTMAVVHSALRRDLKRARIVLTAPEQPSADRRRALADHLVWMMSFLNRHHTGEDTGLYPEVLRKNPGARELLEGMDAEHQAIHPAMDRLTAVAQAYRPPGTATGADLLGAIEKLEAVLYPHLKREEEEMMPVVAASITAADWQRWDREHNVKGIGFRELAATGLWILDGQDPVSDALIGRSVPPPVRVIIKKGFGPGYRRKSAALWGTEAARVPALSADRAEVQP
jgi:hemerythrin-like domain-containing protein